MRTFFWDVKYALNVPELDAQHKKLFSMLRELQLDVYDGVAEKLLVERITQMQCYIHEHFTAEEALMQAHKEHLPMLEEHLAQHAEFAAVSNSFMLRLQNEGKGMVDELCSFLENWIISHIYTMDKRTFAAIQALEDANPVASFERGFALDANKPYVSKKTL